MLNFQEEGENFGDMGVPISDIDVLKKKNSKENKNYTPHISGIKVRKYF